MQTGTVLFHELVAHGKHSGDNLTTRFSNAADSLQSSLGLFVTDDTYVGQNGYSLRLDGLDPGVNDRARERAIVVHGAPYVDQATARTLGRLGRSWGCPAVSTSVARPLIDAIKGGTAVFAYHPSPARTTSISAGACAVQATAAAP
jgi:L,D-transpeptidase catalytic domain